MKLSMRYLICFYILTTFVINTAFAQSSRDKLMLQATSDFQSLKYLNAIANLEKVLAIDSGNVQALEMIAFSYRQTKKYPEALTWYEKLSKQKPLKQEWVLYYAEALANAQQYERSENWYRAYLSMVPSDKRASAFARSNTGSLSPNSEFWKVALTNLNTSASEYSPVYYKQGLLFNSNRAMGATIKKVFPWDNTPYTNLFYIAKLSDIGDVNSDAIGSNRADSKNSSVYNDDDTAPTSNDSRTLGQYNSSFYLDSSGTMMHPNRNIHLLKGNVNTRFHEGPAAVFPDGSLIFTRNNYYKGTAKKSKTGINKLKLYLATGKNLDKITEFPYNSNEYSTGHPALTADGNILIFSSDMPGGFGGTDLYYSVRSGTQWTRPINLGKQINTEGNEQFSSLSKDGTLFFSSTGHAGLGGLDVFEVMLKDMKPQYNPRNLGMPINSSKDDFGLIRSDDGKSGYFSSNRTGNDNIYNFSQATYRISLEGLVTDARTRIALAGSRLLLKTLDRIDTITANSRGEFKYNLKKETDYEVTAQKLGYISQMVFTTSVGITTDSVIRLDMKLNKTESLQQYVINNCDSLKRVFAVDNIYYDLDRDEIRSDARPSLDALAALMKRHPEMTVITSSHCDSRASEGYNRNLSLRRGGSAKNYLVSKGISGSRVKIEYYGKTRLVNRCYDGVVCSEANQQLNRRTEFDVIINGVNLTQQNCNDR
ncbi:OmpA family protein [Arcticibacter eurypsychrophilus]|uniref:OmpA family protein n=1 Tax=Arcticibacter eurypsychrophilus TaxID=1434752 RepID=UPI00084D1EDE|nr:OmpA family protein [Arcticibacter eurypsychrophilus]